MSTKERFQRTPRVHGHRVQLDLSPAIYAKVQDMGRQLEELGQVDDGAKTGPVITCGLRLLAWYLKQIVEEGHELCVRDQNGNLKPVEIDWKNANERIE